jgi:hypothetical protein
MNTSATLMAMRAIGWLASRRRVRCSASKAASSPFPARQTGISL